MKYWGLSAAALLAALTLGGIAQAAEPACSSYTPAIIGGPVPAKNSSIVVLRWLGNANYEVDYQGHVFLFDTYFDRSRANHDIGVTVPPIKRADAIFVSHAHFDHIADVGADRGADPCAGRRRGADRCDRREARRARRRDHDGKDGDKLHFGDVTLDVGWRSTAPSRTPELPRSDNLQDRFSRPNTPEEDAH